MHRTQRRFFISAALALACATSPVLAQTAPWPSQPIKLVVGFPAGSSPDLMARTLSEPLAQALGQPVVVENRAGAGGNIAAAAVARATDHHTLGLMINGNLTIAKILNPDQGTNTTATGSSNRLAMELIDLYLEPASCWQDHIIKP